MRELILNWIKRFYFEDSTKTVEDLIAHPEFATHKFFWMLALLIGIFVISMLIWWVTKEILLGFMVSFASKTKTNFDDLLVKNKFFRAIAHLLPLMFLDYFFSIAFFAYPKTLEFADRINEVLIAFTILVALKRLLRTTGQFLREKPAFEGKPINAYVQTVNIVLSIIVGVIILSLLTGQSPTFFLTSLGAMTAILLLVFKDTILGFVGSIQIAVNDMVRVGDWVSMEKYGADGDVIEINLTTVKVQNWDRTITTIPTYNFIADSFKNWRGMADSGGRRIKRDIAIRMESVKFASPRLIEKLQKVKFLSEFVTQRQREIANYNQAHNLTDEQLNARKQTNIGLFRRYLEYYLKHNESIHQGMTIMVRQLQPTSNGVPIEIYCFTNTIAWLEYEAIQADIFDHIFAVVNEFELQIHENPSGADMRAFVDSKTV